VIETPKPQIIGGAPAQHWAKHIRERTAKVLRQHAPAELVEALYFAAAENQARRVDYCGHLWAEYANSDHHYVYHLLRCKSRWCPYCGSVWQRQTMRKIEEGGGVPPGYTTTLLTVTTGKRIKSTQLRATIKKTVQVWKKWRKWAEGHGIAGGIYSIEVVPPEGDKPSQGWHVHLHSTVLVDKSAPWFLSDCRFLEGKELYNGATSPALVWFARSWALILREHWRERYDRLKPVEKLLPSIGKTWPGITVESPGRIAVCDIGGRWPDPKKKDQAIKRLDEGDAEDDLRQSLKYISKPLGIDKEGEKKTPPTRQSWIDLIEAMAGRRRAQTWGLWYNIKPPEPEEAIDDMDPEEDKIERTGIVLLYRARRQYDMTGVIEAYWYGYRQIGMIESDGCFQIAYVESGSKELDGL